MDEPDDWKQNPLAHLLVSPGVETEILHTGSAWGLLDPRVTVVALSFTGRGFLHMVP